jgi:hypothetical protein
VLDVVAPDEDELSLTVEAERVDQSESRLAGPAPRDPQSVRESEPINDRQRHQDGDPTDRQKSDLDDTVVAERKVIQPLHAESRARAADRASEIVTSRRADGSRRTFAPERVSFMDPTGV